MSDVNLKDNPSSTHLRTFIGRIEVHKGSTVKHVSEMYRSHTKIELSAMPSASTPSKTESKVFKTKPR